MDRIRGENAYKIEYNLVAKMLHRWSEEYNIPFQSKVLARRFNGQFVG